MVEAEWKCWTCVAKEESQDFTNPEVEGPRKSLKKFIVKKTKGSLVEDRTESPRKRIKCLGGRGYTLGGHGRSRRQELGYRQGQGESA